MKKIFIIIASIIMLTACTGNKGNSNYTTSVKSKVSELHNTINDEFEKVKSKSYENLSFDDFEIDFPEISEIHKLGLTHKTLTVKEACEIFEEYFPIAFAGRYTSDDLDGMLRIIPMDDRLIVEHDDGIEDSDVEEYPFNFPLVRDVEEIVFVDDFKYDCIFIETQEIYMVIKSQGSMHAVNKGEAVELNGKPNKLAGPYYIEHYNELIATYSTDELKDESYPLLDGEMKVVDAVDFAKDYFNNKVTYNKNPEIKVDIPLVEVYKINEEVYAYHMIVRDSINQIPFEYSRINGPIGILLNSSDKKEYDRNHALCFMVRSDDMDFYACGGQTNNIEYIGEEITEIISLENAVNIASEYTSKSAMFNVLDIEFVYTSSYNDDNIDRTDTSRTASPTWLLKTYNPNDGRYYHIYVDAVDGRCWYFIYTTN